MASFYLTSVPASYYFNSIVSQVVAEYPAKDCLPEEWSFMFSDLPAERIESYATHAVDAIARWLGGSQELPRDEKDILMNFHQRTMRSHWEDTIVDYETLENFSLHSLRSEGVSIQPPVPFETDFLLTGGVVEIQSEDTYAWSYTITIIKLSGSVADMNGLTLTCPEGKSWCAAYASWTLVSGPQESEHLVGICAGVELLVGFLTHVDAHNISVVVDEEEEKGNSSGGEQEIVATKFELLGIGAFSKEDCLGCGFYKFTINAQGKVAGFELGQQGEPDWEVPISGRASFMPPYCHLKLYKLSETLQLLENIETIEEVIEAFRTIRRMVEVGRTPTLGVSDVIAAGKKIRDESSLGKLWDRSVAQEFGALLKALKVAK